MTLLILCICPFSGFTLPLVICPFALSSPFMSSGSGPLLEWTVWSSHGTSLTSFTMQTASLMILKIPRLWLLSTERAQIFLDHLRMSFAFLFVCFSENAFHTNCPQSLLHFKVSPKAWNIVAPVGGKIRKQTVGCPSELWWFSVLNKTSIRVRRIQINTTFSRDARCNKTK